MKTLSETRRSSQPLLAGLFLSGTLALSGSLACANTEAEAESAQSLRSIELAAENYVHAQIPPGANGVSVTANNLDPRLRFVRCTGPLQTSVMTGMQMQARMSVAVSCHDGTSWTVYVPVTVESDVPVLVLKSPAIRGARLTPDQVAQETRRVSGLTVGYVTDVHSLEHSTLKQPMVAGAVLTQDSLEPDLIVQQGEEVTMVAEGGGVEVRASGKALQAGREGNRIKVQNLASLKVVEGVVDASRVIHVTP